MARDADPIGASLLGVVALVAGHENREAALAAIGVILAVVLFVFIYRSFDDRDLGPK